MAHAIGARLLGLAASAVVLVAGAAHAADTVVQVPVDGLIDGRTVSTFTGGAVVPWGTGQGVDGDGNADGYVTTAVEAELVKQGKTVGGVAGKALPDDGLFPMDARHPAIQLHFSNAADKASPQTRQLYIAASRGPQSFQLPVPAATYSKMFLILTASEGAAELTLTLNYAGGAAPVVTKLKLPDYGVGGAAAGDKVFFNLIDGMRKWTAANQEGDGPSHTITGIELAPSATDKLTSIGIEKTNGSHVVFWGATGVATSAVDIPIGGGGTGGGSAGGAAGAAGANTGGASGAGGSGGSATAGAPNSAGAATAGAAGSIAAAGQAGAATSGFAGNAATVVTPNGDDSSCSFSPARRASSTLWILLAAGCAAAFKRRAVRSRR